VGLRTTKHHLSDGMGTIVSLFLVSICDIDYEPSYWNVHQVMISLKIEFPGMERKGAHYVQNIPKLR
jgi:hypothetical protein